jgi:hypothetical protein
MGFGGRYPQKHYGGRVWAGERMNFILLIALAAATLTAVVGGLLCRYTPLFAAESAKNAVIPPFSSGKNADLNNPAPPTPPIPHL